MIIYIYIYTIAFIDKRFVKMTGGHKTYDVVTIYTENIR